jgi:hypothetical protein
MGVFRARLSGWRPPFRLGLESRLVFPLKPEYNVWAEVLREEKKGQLATTRE